MHYWFIYVCFFFLLFLAGRFSLVRAHDNQFYVRRILRDARDARLCVETTSAVNSRLHDATVDS